MSRLTRSLATAAEAPQAKQVTRLERGAGGLHARFDALQLGQRGHRAALTCRRLAQLSKRARHIALQAYHVALGSKKTATYSVLCRLPSRGGL